MKHLNVNCWNHVNDREYTLRQTKLQRGNKQDKLKKKNPVITFVYTSVENNVWNTPDAGGAICPSFLIENGRKNYDRR